jgi:hypothetical protein
MLAAMRRMSGQLRAMSALLILAPISGRTLSATLAGVLSG